MLTGEKLPSFATATAGWTYYRLATESGQLLRFFWSADHTQWVVQNKDGSTAIYGAPSSGSSDLSATDQDLNGHIFRWNVALRYDAQRDAGGNPTNRIQYAWSHAQWAIPGVLGRGYLTDIYDTPRVGDAAPATSSFAHHTHLVYGVRLMQPADAPVWRANVTSALTRVDITSQDLTAASTSQRQQVRRYYLTYDTSRTTTPTLSAATLEGGECSPANNFENATTQLLPDPSVANPCAKRPTTTFEYTHFDDSMATASLLPMATGATKPPTLVDVNNDGLPDLLESGTARGLALYVNSTTNAAQPNFSQSVLPSLGGAPIVGGQIVLPGSFQMSGQLDLMLGQAPVTSGSTPPAPPDGGVSDVNPASTDAPIGYQLVSVNTSGTAWGWNLGTQGSFGLTRFFNSDPTFLPFVVAYEQNETEYGDELPYGVADIDGDGLQDLLTDSAWGTLVNNNGKYSVNGGRRLEYRVTRRLNDGSYLPFTGPAALPNPPKLYGGEITAFYAADHGFVCLGPGDIGTQDAQLKTGARTFADINGDGLPDFVALDFNSSTIQYWTGHGDGVFGHCQAGPGTSNPDAVTTLQCACSNAGFNAATFLQSENLPHAALHDLNGDGLADLIAPTPTGFNLYYGAGQGSFWGSVPSSNLPTPIIVEARVGWASNAANAVGASGSPDTYSFADVDGNGLDDVIVQNAGGAQAAVVSFGVQRPFLLIGINAGVASTTISYDTTAHLASVAGSAWGTPIPQNLNVVTSIQTKVLTSEAATIDSYTTSYSYAHPVFDGRDNEFLGFQNVIQTTPGDVSSGVMHTATTFYYGACGASTGTVCPVSPDYAVASYRGLPTLVDTYDGSTVQTGDYTSAVHLSTVHHQYSDALLYQGLDERWVRRVYEAQQDTFLYDTGAFSAASSRVSIADVNAGDLVSNPGFTIYGSTTSTAELERVMALDALGNVQTVTDKGNIVAKPAEDVLVSTTLWGVSANTDAANNWIWRAQSTSSGGTAAASQRSFSYSYDAHGNQTDVYTSLSGSPTSLARTSFGAPQPSGASQNSPRIHLKHVAFDTAGTGNVQTVEAYPSSSSGSAAARCSEYTYDSAYSQLRTTDVVDVGDCNSAGKIVTQRVYDRVLGVVLSTVAPGNERTAMTYDNFGRVLTIAKPNPNLPGASSSPSTTVAYNDTLFGQIIHTSGAGAAAASGLPGYAASDTYVYLDGLGRTQQVVSTSDTSGSWIVSGQVMRDVRGRTIETFTPKLVASANGGAVAVTTPITTFQAAAYDAFSRVVKTWDIDQTQTSQTIYHALSVDSYDAETLKTSGNHPRLAVTTTRDGHGRVTSVMQEGGGGSVTTTTVYQPTGEPTSITKTGTDGAFYARYMQYDSLGRLVVNAEPNASQNYSTSTTTQPKGAPQVWSYAYDDLGDLVGTSDPRMCGENLVYDGAGRIVSEDFSPCTTTQMAYTTPTAATGDGTEAYYVYGAGVLQTLDPTDVYDRASHVHLGRDGRGRVTQVQRQIANPGSPTSALASRYSPTVFTMNATYDERDRVQTQTTGTDVSGYASTTSGNVLGPSTVSAGYSPRGALTSVNSSYGPLVTSTVREVDGRVDSVTYGDAAATKTSYSYDSRDRIAEVKTNRTGSFPTVTGTYTPPSSSAVQPTQQTVLADDKILTRDGVGNPLTVQDARIASEWEPGSAPVTTQTFAYDDWYRLTSVARTYSDGTDAYVPPLASNMPHTSPVPMAQTPSRPTSQTFQYDSLGNLKFTTDDAGLFYDRSLSTIVNGSQAAGTGGPNQLLSASNFDGSGTLAATYDSAGNLTELDVTRPGTCTPGSCVQRFYYSWDEVGQLSEATRYDILPPPKCTSKICPLSTGASILEADVLYAYDAGGARVLRSGTENDGTTTYSAEIFPSLRLDHTTWDATTSTYERGTDTEAVYLTLGGTSYGRLVYAPNAPAIKGPLHVFLELTDPLSSTATVIDKDTSELVERTTYLAYGQIDSDYRPDRWQDFREDYKFTGKEEDVEFGITYFGARYYSAMLGRWISPDPLAIHGFSGDLNPYAYVRGRVTVATDPAGLDESYSGGYDDGYASYEDPPSLSCDNGTAVSAATAPGESAETFAPFTVTPVRGQGAPAASAASTGVAPGAGPVVVTPGGAGANRGDISETSSGDMGLNILAGVAGFATGLATGFALGVLSAACIVCGIAIATYGAYALADGGAAAIVNSVGSVASGTATPGDYFALGAVVGGITGAKLAPSSGSLSLRGFLADERGGIPLPGSGSSAAQETRTLFHYTNEAGQAGILESETLNPSLKALNPADARYGDGQYLSDIEPGTKTPAQLSRAFVGRPFFGSRFTNWVEIDVTGLNVVQGRPGVFVIPNSEPLDLAGRIVGSGGQ